MVQRIITSFIILALVIPPLIFGGILLKLLVALILILAGIEWMQMDKSKDMPKALMALSIIMTISLLLVPSLVRLALLGLYLIIIFTIPVFTTKVDVKQCLICSSYIALFAIIAIAFVSLYSYNNHFIWLIAIATYGCDSGAYFSGRFLGKHKLNERISPKKTWEGSIGGCILGIILASLYSYFFISEYPLVTMIFIGMLCTIFGQLGDLAFSSIKRYFNIKDFSNLLPGHGGVLDRIDSLVFNFVVVFLVLVVMHL